MELLKLLTFRIGSRSFAIASNNVKEILDSCGNLKGVFYGGKALKGLMNFEGDIISVLESSFVLDLKEDGVSHMILVCKEKGKEKAVGMTITEVRGIKTLVFPQIDAPKEDDPPYISGFIREDEKESGIPLLDLKGFLDYADTKIERF